MLLFLFTSISILSDGEGRKQKTERRQYLSFYLRRGILRLGEFRAFCLLRFWAEGAHSAIQAHARIRRGESKGAGRARALARERERERDCEYWCLLVPLPFTFGNPATIETIYILLFKALPFGILLSSSCSLQYVFSNKVILLLTKKNEENRGKSALQS